MLEAALFSANSEGTSSQNSKYEPHPQSGQDRRLNPNSRPVSNVSMSSSVTPQQLLREEQVFHLPCPNHVFDVIFVYRLIRCYFCVSLD